MTGSRLTLTPEERVDQKERGNLAAEMARREAVLDESVVPRPTGPDRDEIRIRRMIRFWRAAAFISTTLGLIAAFMVVTMPPPPPPPDPEPTPFVAMLAPAGTEASGWIVTLDANYRQIALVPFGDVAARVDQVHELWFATDAVSAPQSLGVIEKAIRVAAPPEALANGGVLTVTAEPPGGSPSGQPTGPLAFSGVLHPVK